MNKNKTMDRVVLFACKNSMQAQS